MTSSYASRLTPGIVAPPAPEGAAGACTWRARQEFRAHSGVHPDLTESDGLVAWLTATSGAAITAPGGERPGRLGTRRHADAGSRRPWSATSRHPAPERLKPPERSEVRLRCR